MADHVTGVKGGAKVTYSILDDDNTGARINDANTGVISDTTTPGTVKAKISIAATNKYAATSREINVTFTKKPADDLDPEIDDQTLQWGTSSDTPTKPDWDEGTHGKIFFKVADYGTAGVGAMIARETGVISGTTHVGEITVTVAIEGGTKYNPGDVGTFKVTFIAKESSSRDLDHGIADQTSVEWGTDSAAPSKPLWAAETHGEIFFKVDSFGETGDDSAIDPESGVISDTTHVGVVTVTVAIKGGSKYNSGDVGTFDVEFTEQQAQTKTAPKLTFIEPQSVNFGTKSSAPASPTDYDEDTMGAIIYKVTGGTASDGATIDGDGRVLTTKVGQVVVTATTTGGTHYAAGKIGSYTVTVQKLWVDIDDVPQITNPTSVPLGGTSKPPNTGELSEKYGKLIFEIIIQNTGHETTINPDNGEVSGAEYPGLVEVLYYSTEGSDTYHSSEYIGIYHVMFTQTQVSFSPPPNVTVGTKSDAPTMTGIYDEEEYNETIQYNITGGTASDGATIDGDGKVTATRAGTVIVTVTVEESYEYEAIIPLGSYTVKVTE